MASKRIQELDALRGLAAIAVVLFHYTFRYEELFGFSSERPWMLRTGYLGVQLFFIVSGFVIFMTVDRTDKPLDFVFSRFSRLYPTYWAGVLVTTLVVKLGFLPEMQRTLQEVLVNLTMLHEFFNVPPVDGVYWTLTRELMFYGIVLAVFSLGLLRFWIPLAYGWLGIQCAANLAMWLAGDFPYRIRFWMLTEFCHLFIAGIAFYEIYKSRRASVATYGLLVFAALNHFLLEVRDLPASRFEEGIYVLIFFALMMAIVHGKLKFLAVKPLVFLGSISYALYLVHQFLGYSIMRAFEQIGLSMFAAIAVSTGLSLILATAMTYYVEQPALRFLRHWYGEWRADASAETVTVANSVNAGEFANQEELLAETQDELPTSRRFDTVQVHSSTLSNDRNAAVETGNTSASKSTRKPR